VAPVSEVIEVGLRVKGFSPAIMLTWAALAIALFISGAVLVSIGVDKIFSQSIISVAVDVFNLTTLPSTIKALIVIGLCLIAFCDAIVIFLLFLLRPSEFRIFGKWKIRNWLGGHKILVNRGYELTLLCIGLVALVVSIATIIFALGFTVMSAQLVARIVCKEVFTREIQGVNLQQVCVA